MSTCKTCPPAAGGRGAAPSLAELPPDVQTLIEQCRLAPHPESHLIEVLHRLQQAVGYLRPEHLDSVAQLMQVPTARVTGVATFYHLFTFVPQGKHRISVCLGTACFVKGAGRIMERIRELLDVQEGHPTADGQFSLHCARCVGACALAPVVIVDEKVYGNVKLEDVPRILTEFGYDPKSGKKK